MVAVRLRTAAGALVVAVAVALPSVLGAAAPAAAEPARLDEGSLFTYDRSSGAAGLFSVADDASMTRTWSGRYTTGYTHVVGMDSTVVVDDSTGTRYEGADARRVLLYSATTGRSTFLLAASPSTRPARGSSRGLDLPAGMETVVHQNDHLLLLDRDAGRWETTYSGVRSDVDPIRVRGRVAAGYRAVDARGGVVLLFADDGRWAVARGGQQLRPTGTKGRFAVGYERAENVEADGDPRTSELLLYSTDDARYALVRAGLGGVTVLDHGVLPWTRHRPYALEGLGPRNGAEVVGAQTSPTTLRRTGFAAGPRLRSGSALLLPQPLTGAAWVSHLPAAPCELC